MAKLFDLDAYQATSEELKKYIDKVIKKATDEIVIQEDSYLKFPSVGQEHAVYMDTTSKTMYRWDETNLKYYVFIDNYENIDIIDGRGK